MSLKYVVKSICIAAMIYVVVLYAVIDLKILFWYNLEIKNIKLRTQKEHLILQHTKENIDKRRKRKLSYTKK